MHSLHHHHLLLLKMHFFLAAPKVSNITEDGCLVEWSPLKQIPGQGDLQYRVQLTKPKKNETKTVRVFELKSFSFSLLF